MRYRRDVSWRAVDDTTILAGSPLRLYRLSVPGAAVVARAATVGIEPSSAERRLLDRLVAGGALHPVPDHGPFTTADVTVVVPAHGPVRSPGSLHDRVIVVDDASDVPVEVDDTRVSVLRLDSNVGPGAARTAGLAHVTTSLVAFVDTDIELPPQWLDGLLPQFADESVVAVAPRVASRPGPSRLERYEATRSPLDLGPEPALVAAGSRVSYVPTAVLVARCDALREHDPVFDTELRFGEDVDLLWRLTNRGGRVRYEPDVVAWHRPRDTWTAAVRQRVSYGSSAAPLALRHGAAAAPFRCSPWSAGVWGLLLVGRRWSIAAAGVLAAGTVVSMSRRLVRVPRREAGRLVVRGHALAGVQLARAVRRAWWPLAVVIGAVGGRHVRRALVTLVAGSVVLDAAGARRGSSNSPTTDALIQVGDDLAYSAGVWRGVLRQRSVECLLPRFSAWPPRDAG